MIRLTVSSDKRDIRTFSKNLITIGSGVSPVDIVIPDADLQPIHIKIIDETVRVVAQNTANDPFITLNNLPFGKKILKENDVFQIGNYEILFESVPENFNEPTQDLNFLYLEEKIEPLEEEVLRIEQTLHSKENTTPEIDTILEKEDKESLNIRKEDVENISSKPVFQSVIIQDIEDDTPPSPRRQLDFEVGEFDDESENWVNDKVDKIIPLSDESFPRPFFSLKFLSAITLALLLITGLVSGALYFNKSAKNEGEEFKAAEGIADIAMALKYAQIQHIKPHKKNWSDPEFIKNSLAHVIPHDYPTLTNIDSQGHINHTGYSLRIYTSSDFSQFLVIAQPAPSLLQSLIPKTAIVIDSKLMQLKKVVDMKTLNRLLVNSNNLDNSNAIEVTNLVKKGELIPLSALSQKRKGNDFSPPKALSLIRPGAENYIYNSPRYYQLGETILKKAVYLMESTTNPYELSRLKQEMSMLSKMQDLVLYSPEGIEQTIEIQKAIATFAPNSKFLTAFLKFTSQGTIATSHLIIDNEHPLRNEKKIDLPSMSPNILSELAENSESFQSKEPINVPLEKATPVTLLEKFELLKGTRQNSLMPLKNKIIFLLNDDALKPVNSFDKQISDLLMQYYEMDVQQKQLMGKAIVDYSVEYSKMPLKLFIDNLNLAGLLDGSQEILKHVIKNDDEDKKIQDILDNIEKAENFIDLNDKLSQALSYLVVPNFFDLTYLQFLQMEVKSEALKIVNNWLFSSKPTPLAVQYTKEHKNALKELLSSTWLEDSTEQIYYLEEFDRLGNKEAL